MPKAINLNIKVHCRFDLLQASNTLSDRLRPCCCQRVSWSEKCHNVKRFYLLGFLWEDSTYKSQIFSLLYLFIQSSSVTQSCLTLCNPMDRSMPGLPITNSQSLLKLMSIESVMPSNHLILRRPLLLLPSIFPSIRVFSNESVLRIRWPKYWSFRFSIGPSNEYSGLISFRMD